MNEELLLIEQQIKFYFMENKNYLMRPKSHVY